MLRRTYKLLPHTIGKSRVQIHSKKSMAGFAIERATYPGNCYHYYGISRGTDMDKKYLNEEFDRFFEFPNDDKSTVSSTSAKLFAEHIAYPVLMDNAKLTETLERVTDVCKRKLKGDFGPMEAMKNIENIILIGEQGN